MNSLRLRLSLATPFLTPYAPTQLLTDRFQGAIAAFPNFLNLYDMKPKVRSDGIAHFADFECKGNVFEGLDHFPALEKPEIATLLGRRRVLGQLLRHLGKRFPLLNPSQSGFRRAARFRLILCRSLLVQFNQDMSGA